MAAQLIERLHGVSLAVAAQGAITAGTSYNAAAEVAEAEPTVTVMPVNAWASVYRQGDSHDRHMHPNTALAAVYYIETPYSSPGLVLHDPRAGIDYFHPAIRMSAEGSPLEVPVSAGDLLLLPGWLTHSVLPFAGTGTRIAISYNLVFSAGTGTMSSTVIGPNPAVERLLNQDHHRWGGGGDHQLGVVRRYSMSDEDDSRHCFGPRRTL